MSEFSRHRSSQNRIDYNSFRAVKPFKANSGHGDPHIFCDDKVKSKAENCVSTAHVDSIFLAMSKNTQMFIQILMLLTNLYIGSSCVSTISYSLMLTRLSMSYIERRGNNQ